METTNVQEGTNVTPITAGKPKRTRAPRKAVASAPSQPAPVVRSLEELSGVEFSAMSQDELMTVALSQSAELEEGHRQLSGLVQENSRLSNQISRYQARMAYIKQTINHAQTSIVLQMEKE